MIEEAAGTRMYECKKISAQKTIEKKEAKLKEIQTVCLTSKHIFLPMHLFILWFLTNIAVLTLFSLFTQDIG